MNLWTDHPRGYAVALPVTDMIARSSDPVALTLLWTLRESWRCRIGARGCPLCKQNFLRFPRRVPAKPPFEGEMESHFI